jgi:type VI secretion system protein ImpE
MLAQQLINEGNLPAALKALQDTVRNDPSSAKHRVFLFQLLTVLGNWPRALTQLDVAGKLDASTMPMVQTYREAIQCEALRAEIFAGKRPPMIFGEPEQWVVLLLEALRLNGDGEHIKAAAARERAFDAAPASSGTINGEAFEWIADVDQRLGPILEAIVNGRYYWIPFHRIKQIDIEAPADLRDSVWMPVSFTWVNGGETVGLIPTRYNETISGEDNSLLLSRRTEWVGVESQPTCGLGQRMFATDARDFALMDVRQIIFDNIESNG